MRIASYILACVLLGGCASVPEEESLDRSLFNRKIVEGFYSGFLYRIERDDQRTVLYLATDLKGETPDYAHDKDVWLKATDYRNDGKIEYIRTNGIDSNQTELERILRKHQM